MAIQQTTPWDPQHAPIRRGLGIAQTLGAQRPEYYSGSTVTPFSDFTNQALNAQWNRGMYGAPHEQAFNNYLTGTLGQNQFDLSGAGQMANQAMGGLSQGMNTLGQAASGMNLHGNPYLNNQFTAATSAMSDRFEDATNAINASFGGAGRTGSNAHANAMGEAAGQYSDSLANMAANIYGGNYQAERDRQMQAAGALQQGGFSGAGLMGNLYGNIDQSMARAGAFAPTLSNMQYNNISQMGQVGQAIDRQAQNYLQDDINRFNFAQQAPWQQLQQYMGVVGHPYGQNAITPDPQGNRFAQALGGAGAGAALGTSIGGPWGAGIGALTGGVAGALNLFG